MERSQSIEDAFEPTSELVKEICVMVDNYVGNVADEQLQFFGKVPKTKTNNTGSPWAAQRHEAYPGSLNPRRSCTHGQDSGRAGRGGGAEP